MKDKAFGEVIKSYEGGGSALEQFSEQIEKMREEPNLFKKLYMGDFDVPKKEGEIN